MNFEVLYMPYLENKSRALLFCRAIRLLRQCQTEAELMTCFLGDYYAEQLTRFFHVEKEDGFFVVSYFQGAFLPRPVFVITFI